MDILTEKEITAKIRQGRLFEAQIDTGAFEISIKKWNPAVFTAIHDGHRVGTVYSRRMIVSSSDRKFEEDPYTAAFISDFPISLKVLDSRYQYDLNRTPRDCIYDIAWGKKVWREQLPAHDRKRIIAWHATYYRVLQTLIGELEARYSRCVLYDLHSYNYSRHARPTPLFNIGTHFIKREPYQVIIDHLRTKLSALKLPGIESICLFDDIFEGKGYQAAFIKEHFPESLCIPLEIKKVFMDEYSFSLTEEIFYPLLSGVTAVLAENALLFTDLFAREAG